MSDITITVTADQKQAIEGLAQVRKEGERLAETQRKVQEASDAAATDAMNSVSTVSSGIAQTASEAVDGLRDVSSGIKSAGNEASKVAGAFGKSIPVIGQIGSAIAAALTGPVAAVSAVIGLAIAQINKMIAETEARVQRLKMQAGTQAGTAYDNLMQGRAQYAQDLQTLAQVKQIQAVAKQSALTASQLAQFQKLAGQLGIDSKYVGASGIRSGRIEEAEKSLLQQRKHYAKQEYQEYLDALSNQLQREINSSALDPAVKKSLAGKSLSDLAAEITSRARRGAGNTTEEYKAYQDLYQIVKPLAEVQASYKRDRLLGRSQADLNAAAVAAITSGAASASAAASGGSASGPAKPGTLAYYKEQQKKEAAALAAEQKEQERRTDAAARLTEGLERQIRIQQLISDGKEKEAFILQNRLRMEDAVGRTLSETEAADNARLAATLYDLQHPVLPEPEPEAVSANPAAATVQARARAASASALHLDRLQRLGANAARAATSPEKLVMDRQLSAQESIKNTVAAIAASLSGSGNYTMRF